jgi:hypothetical protein
MITKTIGKKPIIISHSKERKFLPEERIIFKYVN